MERKREENNVKKEKRMKREEEKERERKAWRVEVEEAVREFSV